MTNCPLGYHEEELREILEDRYDEFMQWMNGQTMAVCDEHGGFVVYKWDLSRFLNGLPIID